MKLLAVSFVSWLGGVAVYTAVAGRHFTGELLVYGGFFAALPAVGLFWLALVPAFSWLRRKLGGCRPLTAFQLLSVGSCVLLAAVLNAVPKTASGPLSSEAMQFYIVYAVIGVLLAWGYVRIYREAAA